MPKSLNNPAFGGHAGSNAKQFTFKKRDGSTGTGVSVSFAVNQSYKTQEGWVNDSFWVRATLFGKEAEWLLKDGVNKGDYLVASGPIAIRTYRGRDGKEKISVEMKASSIINLSTAKGGGGSGGGGGDYDPGFDDADDIPF